MKIHLLNLLFFISLLSFSQSIVITGVVFDKKEKDPLIGVNIISGDIGTTTDIDGKYNLKLENGKHNISFHYIGYETFSIDIDLKNGGTLEKNIYLESQSTEMDLVVISAGKFEQKLEEVTVSMDVIKPTLIENKNTADLEVLMNQSPGVQVVDGQANIRGGSGWSYNTGSRVLVMVDDMPLLSGDRGTVEWSMIPMENISQIEVIKGASSVLFGSSAMNGVINVRTAYPKAEPETKINLFSGQYDTPSRSGLHWWGDDTRRFHGMSFSYAEKKDNTGLVIGGNIYANDGFKGGIVSNSNHTRYGEALPVSEKWGRFNFSTNHNSQKTSGLSYGINGNFVFSDKYESLIFTHDSIGYTPIGVLDGDKPVRFNQMMFNIDPHIKYINENNNTQHSYKSRFFRDDYQPYNNEIGFSNVFFQEYQFQKKITHNNFKIVSSSGVTSNYIKGDYDEIYGEGGSSAVKQLFNYSAYTQFDTKYNRWNISLGVRLEHLLFEDDNYLIPVLRSGVNYQLTEGTFLRSSFGQGYRYPTIMEMFVKTDYAPVYVYPNPDLEAESGWSGEMGIKQLLKIGEWKGMFDVAGFIMHYDNMIEFSFGRWAEWIGYPDTGANLAGFGFKCVNIGKTQITGFETSLVGEGKIGDFGISLLTSYTYVRPVILDPSNTYYESETAPVIDSSGTVIVPSADIILNYDTYDKDENPNGASFDNTNDILKYRHEHVFKFDLNIDYSIITTGLSIRYNSMMQNMDFVFGTTYFNAEPLEGGLINIGILDSRERMLDGDLILDYRFGLHLNENLTVSFIIDNLLNREYQTRPADLGPPRAFTLKLSAKL